MCALIADAELWWEPGTRLGYHARPSGPCSARSFVGRAKYRNLVRDPWAALHVTQDDFWAYVVLEGAVELAPIIASVDDLGADEHIEHYRLDVGEHEAWDAVRASLVAQRRSMIRLLPSRAYGMAAWSAPDDD